MTEKNVLIESLSFLSTNTLYFLSQVQPLEEDFSIYNDVGPSDTK